MPLPVYLDARLRLLGQPIIDRLGERVGIVEDLGLDLCDSTAPGTA